MSTLTETQVQLFATVQSWMEGEAVRQLYATARLDGMRRAVGFPDLHPGKGTPNGAAFLTEGMLYPHLIGGDIGCGMGFFRTDLARRKAKPDRWSKLDFRLEHPCEGDLARELEDAALESTDFDQSFGTVGAGNHFAELQCVEEVLQPQALKDFGLGKEDIAVLVHSGSRGLGESVFRTYAQESGASGVAADSLAADEYLRDHDFAVRWARASRGLLARRMARVIGAEVECLWDGSHNNLTRREDAGATLWLHRKGAASSEQGPVVIPGTRGTLSYLVKPERSDESNAWSLAHGAGRKWSRSESRTRMRERFRPWELTQTALGGQVICEERDLLYEEAPPAYKNIEAVIRDLESAGLISVIATLRPLLTYKTRRLR